MRQYNIDVIKALLLAGLWAQKLGNLMGQRIDISGGRQVPRGEAVELLALMSRIQSQSHKSILGSIIHALGLESKMAIASVRKELNS